MNVGTFKSPGGSEWRAPSVRQQVPRRQRSAGPRAGVDALANVTTGMAADPHRVPISRLGGVVALSERRMPVGAIGTVARMSSVAFEVSTERHRCQAGKAVGMRKCAVSLTKELV